MKKLIRKIILWAFNDDYNKIKNTFKTIDKELNDLNTKYKEIYNIYDALDLTVDIHTEHRYTTNDSWACFSLNGKKQNYVRFISLGDKDLIEIANFVEKFDKYNRSTIDILPQYKMIFEKEYLTRNRY